MPETERGGERESAVEQIPSVFGKENLKISGEVLQAKLGEIQGQEVKRDSKRNIVENPGGLEGLKLKKSGVTIEGVSMGKDLRKPNQDSMFGYVDREGSFFCAAVLDGVGGQFGGDKASNEVSKRVFEKIKTLEYPTYEEILRAIKTGADEANTELNRLGYNEADSTMSLVFGVPNSELVGETEKQERGWDVYTVNVGDSRVYFADGENLKQVTQDDGLVEVYGLSDFQKKIHNKRNVVTATVRQPLGKNPNKEEPGLNWFPYTVKRISSVRRAYGFKVFLATDGYTDNFREDPELNEVNEHYKATKSLEELVALAQVRAGQGIEESGYGGRALSKKDDVTVMNVMVEPVKSDVWEKVVEAQKSRPKASLRQAREAGERLESEAQEKLERVVGLVKNAQTINEAKTVIDAYNKGLPEAGEHNASHFQPIEEITLQGLDFELCKDQNNKLELWKLKDFKVGDVVKVKRSDGSIENGWKVYGIDLFNRQIEVWKNDGNDPLEKTVRLKNLRDLNGKWDFSYKFEN